jgi:peptidoglycan/xylan/chitin deacetylase (PgdA/CDA1 family)
VLDKAGLAMALLAVGVLPTLAIPAATATPVRSAGTATLVIARHPITALTAQLSTAVLAMPATGTGQVSASVHSQIRKCYNTTRNVWLTFDDGYTSQANLSSILHTLKASNVRARFFLVGSWARSHPAMVRAIRAGGHYLENHTSTHPSLTRISNAAVLKQIAGGVSPNTSPRLLRPPYGEGAYSSRLYSLARAKGYKLCSWAVDTRDWSHVSASVIVNKVVHGDRLTPPARAGDPILMHLSNTQTRYALPGMIKALRAKRLTFDKLR